MLQWYLRFSEFPELNESSAPFRENSIEWKITYKQHAVSTGCIQKRMMTKYLEKCDDFITVNIPLQRNIGIFNNWSNTQQ